MVNLSARFVGRGELKPLRPERSLGMVPDALTAETTELLQSLIKTNALTTAALSRARRSAAPIFCSPT
jgi:hypothetical protein